MHLILKLFLIMISHIHNQKTVDRETDSSFKIQPKTTNVKFGLIQKIFSKSKPEESSPKSISRQKISDGSKTVPMIRFLEAGALVHYDPIKQTLKHNDLEFHILKGSQENISQVPIVSIGENPLIREIICLDPQNAPTLEGRYQELLSLLENESLASKPERLSQKKVLEIISDFVSKKLFNVAGCYGWKLDDFIKQWIIDHSHESSAFTSAKDGQKIPVIPLDDFAAKGIGMCRQTSFATAFYLHRILSSPDLQNLLPPGKVYHVRDHVLKGGHSWNLYIPDDRSFCWHIDPFWEVIADLNDPDEKKVLYIGYGETCIEREIKRFFLQTKY
jgi:hypothetical protein